MNYEPVRGQYSTGFVIPPGSTELHTVMLLYISQTCLIGGRFSSFQNQEEDNFVDKQPLVLLVSIVRRSQAPEPAGLWV